MNSFSACACHNCHQSLSTMLEHYLNTGLISEAFPLMLIAKFVYYSKVSSFQEMAVLAHLLKQISCNDCHDCKSDL